MKTKRFLKKAMTILMLLTLFVSSLPAVGVSAAATAAEIEAAKQKREALQQEYNKVKDELAKIQDDVEKAEQKTKTAANRKYIVSQQIAAIQESIALKEEELTLRQKELDLKQAEHQRTYELFKKRLRAMVMTNDTSALSAILGASTFSEFLLRTEMTRKISEHDTELIEKLKQEQAAIEAAQAVIEEELTSLDDDKKALDATYAELAAIYQEANAALSSAEALEEVTQEEYDRILAERNQANAELNALMGTGSDTIYGTGEYLWPVPGFSYVSSGFGPRTLYGRYNYHTGIDIAGAGIYGARVVAADDGMVIRALYYTTGYGYHVMIDHGGNNWTVYGHLSSIAVSYGNYVNKGDKVGAVGSTGNSTGPHLHFEIRLKGTCVNPLPYL